MKKIKKKSVGTLCDEFAAKMKKNKYDVDKSIEGLRADLIAYYSTGEGLKELQDSPHKDLPVEDAVNLLLMSVNTEGLIIKKIKGKAK